MPKLTEYLNIQMGLIGGLIMGSIVLWVNLEAGISAAMVAAFKQASYTFFFGGLVVRFCEYLSLKFNPKILSLLIATIVPATIAILATYLVHQIKGTPKPIDSTIPTILLSIPGFLFISYRKRLKPV